MTPSLAELWRVYGRIGLLSFGGPAAQIALMHKELVEDRPWLQEKQFLGALSFCMLLPGPEAMQLATYSGWKLRGTIGGLIAGLLFVLPGAAIILALALLYVNYGTLPLVQAAFVGVKAAVVIVVLQALWKVANKALTSKTGWVIAALSFLAIFALALPFPLIVLTAALYGAFLWRKATDASQEIPLPKRGTTLPNILIWGGLWLAPIAFVAALDQAFLTQIALFFSKLAVVTFGGAYAVLAYMTQTVSVDYGWITTPQMIDALGLAETTPGPLILVTEFVALLAGFQHSGYGMMLAAGALAVWCTFTPCFLWIFTAAPYVEWLLNQPRLNAALAAITSAVVGVVLNLSIWFALHVVFAKINTTPFGPLPVFSSFDPMPIALMALAAALMLWRKVSLPLSLLICAAVALGMALVF